MSRLHAQAHDHHDHDHGDGCAHAHALGGHHHHGSGRVLVFSLCFTLVFAVVELVGGWVSGSLALMSDAGHMFTDSSSLAIGAVAAWLARRPASRVHSFGLQRAEVLGALVNAVLMIGVVVAIAVSAIDRLFSPAPVTGGMVLVIAGLGLLVNLIIGFILLRGEQTMNVRGALLHVMGDLAGSVAAMVAGIVIMATGWTPIDPILSLFVSLLIAISAFPLLRDVLRVLMEGVPRDVDTGHVSRALIDVEGVRSVHDLHVWTLSSSQRALAAHVEIARLAEWETILPRLQTMLAERFAITHTTLQPEGRDTADSCGRGQHCGVASAG
ncbi:cation diffusion facilitator family transporter [Salinisphaera sp. Q1T1-3]|uniref:cation diffusion facilitator family transporter n=1 Tax=Salinisphaera sp. Q1T1-3 TaxID=2321229 RepID=UPI000E71DDFF|nr:cation diffusion facilitator family transporter [Salinisphaera sp. Q1T1-3]RJS93355.1 cation transporter [Salinisphaera sp. Q1T1-3]